MAKSAFQNFASKLKDDYTSLAFDAEGSGEFSGCIDTGCYIFNAILSGSIYGGIPNNKIVALCGEEATGKSFLALGVIKSFLDSHPEASVVMYETEAAINKQTLEERNIDTKRVIISNPDTIQTFQTHALQMLDHYADQEFPLMIVLDSLGMLSTTKELADSTSGKDVADMTRAKAIRAAFRTLTLKCAKYKVPLLLTNHVYVNPMSMYPTKEVAGGGGLKYAASAIIMLSKSKDKDKESKEVRGIFIRAKMFKSRLSRADSEASMKISYNTGLDKYYGLLDLAEEGGIVKKDGNKWLWPNGDKAFESVIYKDPEKYFTKDILDKLEVVAAKVYSYGGSEPILETSADIEKEMEIE